MQTLSAMRACRNATFLSASLVACVIASGGCSGSNASGSGGSSGTSTTTTTTAATTTAGAGGLQGAGGGAGGGADVALPFYVSTEFIPSGFMNDPGGITLSAGAPGATCPDRAPSAGGSCYVITWKSTGPSWAGVYWQYPANNWGSEPGLPIAAGAKQVTFYAKGAVGGESVSFGAGGLGTNPAPGMFGDTVKATTGAETLTTEWQQFTMSVSGMTYSGGVLGGFVWTAASSNDGGTNGDITFYVDDVQWQ